MKQQISALMDGELFDDDAEALLDVMRRRSDADDDWQTYHLIGDILRQPDQAHGDISTRVRARLQAEPTILAPKASARQRARWFALSAAASVLAVGVVAWMSMQIAPETVPQMDVQQELSVRPASYATDGNVNDYLMAHQEMSPRSDVQGAAPYVHSVATGQSGR